jgi:CO/xanthine dehydrogenase FAD-binding subunit
MLTIKEYVVPVDLKEAYELLMDNRKNVILGGTGFIKLGSKSINKAIDLCNLSLDYVREDKEEILIGADTSLRTLEVSEVIKEYCGGVISKAVSNIAGVQLRRTAKVGASVFSKYGFSDVIPALLVLDAKARLYNNGVIELEKFLKNKQERDILIEIILPKKSGIATFHSIRKSSSDFSILNGAMFRGNDNSYRIAIGARPGVAALAVKAAIKLKAKEKNAEEDVWQACKIAAEELRFDSNFRGSEIYRKEMCMELIKKMNYEVGE